MKAQSISIGDLSRLAGISERTLRYYDEIGLLIPGERRSKGTRYYGVDERLRLQQILLYRAMGFGLDQIKSLLDDPGFDLIDSLAKQRKSLVKKAEHMEQLIAAIDKTIEHMNDDSKPLSDQDLYQGLSQEQIEAYRSEAHERWPEEFQLAESRLRNMTKSDIQKLKKEGDEILSKLAQLRRLSPQDKVVQEHIRQYHKHLNQWNETPKSRWKHLADMYVEDERFKATYDQYAKGLAVWLKDAIKVYCQQG